MLAGSSVLCLLVVIVGKGSIVCFDPDPDSAFHCAH